MDFALSRISLTHGNLHIVICWCLLCQWYLSNRWIRGICRDPFSTGQTLAAVFVMNLFVVWILVLDACCSCSSIRMNSRSSAACRRISDWFCLVCNPVNFQCPPWMNCCLPLHLTSVCIQCGYKWWVLQLLGESAKITPRSFRICKLSAISGTTLRYSARCKHTG